MIKKHASRRLPIKRRNIYLLVMLIMLCCIQKGQTQDIGQKKDIGLSFGGGLIFGGDYDDDLKNAFNGNVTGYLGWINIELGLQLKVIKNLYLTPRVRWMVGRVKTSIEGFEFAPKENYNSIYLFGGSFNYYVTEHLYGQASLSFISTDPGISNLDFEPDGFETTFAVGYELGTDKLISALELGYSFVPVIEGGVNKRNYGGIFINIRTRFQFGNYK